MQYMLSGKALQPYHASLQHARLPEQAFVHLAMVSFNPMHRTAAYATPPFFFGSSYLTSLALQTLAVSGWLRALHF
jgi:hypothetical protein